MFFSSIKEIKRLLKEVNRLLSNGMKSFYWQKNFNILSLKCTSPNQFLGAPTQTDITEFSKFLLQLRHQRSGIKTMCSFSLIFILKGIMTFQGQTVRVFCWTKI